MYVYEATTGFYVPKTLNVVRGFSTTAKLIIFNLPLCSQLIAVTCKLALTDSLNIHQVVSVVLLRWYGMPWRDWIKQVVV